MREIVQEPHPVLRQVAQPVDLRAIGSTEIQTIITEMNTALSKEHDGVAIAAPQIGVPLRLFIVSKRASKQFKQNTVFINPEIIHIGKLKEEMSEGCLSVRWKYGEVRRSTTATVRALNSDGNEFVVTGRGLLAQIFQHETDHLNGTLFIDKAKNIEDIPPEK